MIIILLCPPRKTQTKTSFFFVSNKFRHSLGKAVLVNGGIIILRLEHLHQRSSQSLPFGQLQLQYFFKVQIFRSKSGFVNQKLFGVEHCISIFNTFLWWAPSAQWSLRISGLGNSNYGGLRLHFFTRVIAMISWNWAGICTLAGLVGSFGLRTIGSFFPGGHRSRGPREHFLGPQQVRAVNGRSFKKANH